MFGAELIIMFIVIGGLAALSTVVAIINAVANQREKKENSSEGQKGGETT